MIRILSDAQMQPQSQSIVETPPSLHIIFFATRSGEKQSKTQKDDSFNRVSWQTKGVNINRLKPAACLSSKMMMIIITTNQGGEEETSHFDRTLWAEN